MNGRKVYETPGKHNELTDKIIAVFWEVLRELGYALVRLFMKMPLSLL